MMIDRLPSGCATFNKRLSKYTLGKDGEREAPVTLHFSDGSTHEADVLLAADGIKSAVRPQLLKDLMSQDALKPRFTGTTVYRALVPMEEMVEKVGEKVRKGTSKSAQLYFER